MHQTKYCTILQHKIAKALTAIVPTSKASNHHFTATSSLPSLSLIFRILVRFHRYIDTQFEM
jgi:hypothetical protein